MMGKDKEAAHNPVVGLAVAVAYATMSMSLALVRGGHRRSESIFWRRLPSH